MLRFVLAACSFTFVIAVSSSQVRALAATDVKARYLYVAVNERTGQTVLRYPLVGGFPAKHPDRRYAGVTSPMAVERDGTFYAAVTLPSSFSEQKIDIFPPDSNKPSRVITLPNLNQDFTVATAMAVSPGRYLCVGYDAFVSKRASRPLRPVAATPSLPTSGFAIYPPGASGGGPPAQAFNVPDDPVGPGGVVFGPDGDLYAATATYTADKNRIYRISNPVKNPQVVSFIKLSQGMAATTLEFSDGGRNLYAMAYTSRSGSQLEIAVYPYGAQGSGPPARTIVLPEFVGGSLAIDGSHALVNSWQQTPYQVLGYEKHASGSPPPILVLNVASGQPSGILIGP